LDTLQQLNENLPKDIAPQLKAIVLRSLGITQRLIGDLNQAQKNIEEKFKDCRKFTSIRTTRTY
jgi:hypothetical protein